MKSILLLTVLLNAGTGFAITNIRAKCQVQGQPDLSFILVRSITSSQVLHYVNGSLAKVAVAEGNWPDEPGVLHILHANDTVRAVILCERGI